MRKWYSGRDINYRMIDELYPHQSKKNKILIAMKVLFIRTVCDNADCDDYCPNHCIYFDTDICNCEAETLNFEMYETALLNRGIKQERIEKILNHYRQEKPQQQTPPKALNEKFIYRKSNRLCVRCGKPMPLGDGHSRCADCRERDRIAKKLRNSIRKLNHECLQCGKQMPYEYPKYICQDCLNKKSKRTNNTDEFGTTDDTENQN